MRFATILFLIPTYLICQNLENENIPTGLLSQFGDMYTTSINELNDEQRSQLFIKLREIEVEEATKKINELNNEIDKTEKWTFEEYVWSEDYTYLQNFYGQRALGKTKTPSKISRPEKKWTKYANNREYSFYVTPSIVEFGVFKGFDNPYKIRFIVDKKRTNEEFNLKKESIIESLTIELNDLNNRIFEAENRKSEEKLRFQFVLNKREQIEQVVDSLLNTLRNIQKEDDPIEKLYDLRNDLYNDFFNIELKIDKINFNSLNEIIINYRDIVNTQKQFISIPLIPSEIYSNDKLSEFIYRPEQEKWIQDLYKPELIIYTDKLTFKFAKLLISKTNFDVNQFFEDYIRLKQFFSISNNFYKALRYRNEFTIRLLQSEVKTLKNKLYNSLENEELNFNLDDKLKLYLEESEFSSIINNEADFQNSIYKTLKYLSFENDYILYSKIEKISFVAQSFIELQNVYEFFINLEKRIVNNGKLRKGQLKKFLKEIDQKLSVDEKDIFNEFVLIFISDLALLNEFKKEISIDEFQEKMVNIFQRMDLDSKNYFPTEKLSSCLNSF
ncbi:hypothetical protein OAI10_01170 [bacterium]|nr:hypothetical protein [bacterium]